MQSRKLSDIVDRTMEVAMNDVKKTRSINTNIRSIGVGFFPVYMKKDKIDNIDNTISSMINEFLSLKYHSLAWCFPKEIRSYVSEKGNVIPGVFMLARTIKRVL